VSANLAVRRRLHDDRTTAQRLRDGFDEFARRWPARFAILVFTTLILVLWGLLCLPFASADGSATDPVDALFTAVSSICVTGLSTVDMSTHWSVFGNVAILVGLEVGGIGVLTLASLLGLVVSRRLGLRSKLMAASDTNPSRVHAGPISESQAVRLGEIGGMLATVAGSVLVIEAALTVLIVPRLLIEGLDPWAAIWKGFYFAVSAFTNAGFVPTEFGMEPFEHDPWFLGVLSLGVTAGALGFPVIFGLLRWARVRARITLHVKLTLVTFFGLVVLGALAVLALEWNNAATIGAESPGEKALTATFLSFMTRSGGFSTVDVGQMHGSSLLVMDMLMFVGGGSASTAGGIKVTTLAVLFLAAFAEARGDTDMQAFGRRIPQDVLRLGVSVVLWGATIVAVCTVAILQLTGEPLDRVLFDVISAFATCGLSTGLTPDLPPAGKVILAAAMWAGRVGTVTLAAALAASTRRQLFTRAEERPIVG